LTFVHNDDHWTLFYELTPHEPTKQTMATAAAPLTSLPGLGMAGTAAGDYRLALFTDRCYQGMSLLGRQFDVFFVLLIFQKSNAEQKIPIPL
jgi:hypothetical protein